MIVEMIFIAALQAAPQADEQAALKRVCGAAVRTRDDLMEQALQLSDARAKISEAHRAFTYFGQAPDDDDLQAEIDRADRQATSAGWQLEQAERLNRSSRERLDELVNDCFGLVLTPFSGR